MDSIMSHSLASGQFVKLPRNLEPRDQKAGQMPCCCVMGSAPSLIFDWMNSFLPSGQAKSERLVSIRAEVQLPVEFRIGVMSRVSSAVMWMFSVLVV